MFLPLLDILILQYLYTKSSSNRIHDCLHRLRKLVPGKEFIPAPTEQCSCSTCPYMKMNTLEKLYLALRDLSPAVELPEDLRRRAEAPLLRMLEQSQS